MRPADRLPLACLLVVVAVFVASGIGPHDRLTWWLEVFPVVLGVPLLLATYRRFRLTDLVYVLIAIHSVILMVGGHWTYARVPLGFWIQEAFGFARNHYDRIGHIAQGFVPAMIAREVLLRTSPLRRGGWLSFLVVSVCLAISVVYELVEWAAALLSEEASSAFLGTQGDVWDTQWDMFLAGIGAIAAVALLGRRHDRELERLLR